MYPSSAKRLFAAVLMTSIGGVAVAQNSNKENSPYSRYGIGDKRSGTNVMLRGMGSISSAWANPYAVNTDNPASYSWLKVTTYEGAGEASSRAVISPADVRYRTGTIALSYMRIGIPLGKNAGMALGLQPESRMFYHLADTGMTPGLGKTANEHFGDGGLNYAFIGASGKYKDFSIGANFGYLFGSMFNSTQLLSLDKDSPYVYNSRIDRDFTIGGIYFKLGAQYQTMLNKKLMLRLGATANISQEISTSGDEYFFSYRSLSSGGSLSDTVQRNSGGEGKVTLPASYSFGAQLAGTGNWMVGVDVSSTQWSQYRNMGRKDSVTDNTFKIGVGGEYTPNPTSLYNYLERITYRLGFNYGKDYVRLNNTDLNFYSVSVGLSLPFKRSTDKLHTAFELGSRGQKSNGLLRENFVRFSLGISLNDRWFIKRKYE